MRKRSGQRLRRTAPRGIASPPPPRFRTDWSAPASPEPWRHCKLGAAMMFRIAPSVLSADFARLGEEARAVEAAGADLIHFDVMDNHYVPNLSVGPIVCAALRPHVKLPLDVHLMVKPVDRLVPEF